MKKIKLLTTLILGSVISCGDSMGMSRSPVTMVLPRNIREAEAYCRQTFDMFPNTTDGFNGDFGGFAYSMGKLLESSNPKSALLFTTFSALKGKLSAVLKLPVMLNSYQGNKEDDLYQDALGALCHIKCEESFELILEGNFGKAVNEMKEMLACTRNPNEIREIIDANIPFDFNQCIQLVDRKNPNRYATRCLANVVITLKADSNLALAVLINRSCFDALGLIVTNGDLKNQLVKRALKFLINNNCWFDLKDVVIRGNPKNQLHQDALKALIDKEFWWILESIVSHGKPENQLHQDALDALVTNERWDELTNVFSEGNPWNQLHKKAFDALVTNERLYKIQLIGNGRSLFAGRAQALLAKQQKTD